MDYVEKKSAEDMFAIIENIEKYLFNDEYEDAFMKFLLVTLRMNSLDRDELIHYFNRYFRNKYIVIK